jgi:hypothetical protein
MSVKVKSNKWLYLVDEDEDPESAGVWDHS